MLELFQEMWGFAFMRRAFVATTVLSASVAPVGTFLVLRRLLLAGEAMAHAITPSVVISFVLAGLSVTSLLVGGLIAGVGVAVLTAFIARKTILSGDANSYEAFSVWGSRLGCLRRAPYFGKAPSDRCVVRQRRALTLPSLDAPEPPAL